MNKIRSKHELVPKKSRIQLTEWLGLRSIKTLNDMTKKIAVLYQSIPTIKLKSDRKQFEIYLIGSSHKT